MAHVYVCVYVCVCTCEMLKVFYSCLYLRSVTGMMNVFTTWIRRAKRWSLSRTSLRVTWRRFCLEHPRTSSRRPIATSTRPCRPSRTSYVCFQLTRAMKSASPLHLVLRIIAARTELLLVSHCPGCGLENTTKLSQSRCAAVASIPESSHRSYSP